ncbi:DinB family protein [Fulvivirgaceae bacterium BMA10]|uniref:DinB family protein n=1 Tax=Splendidivirga corallicola TaxID=3051826 RepID=A0ABT8KWS3_9BACT|nr:DinB family protein [Fulvivirgaceae bacterium BMA10]
MFNNYLVNYIFVSIFFISCQERERHETIEKQWTGEDRTTLLTGFQESQALLMDLVRPLSNEQWYFKADSNSWSIADIMEHLGLQEDMHFREVYVISKTPMRPELLEKTKNNDDKVLAYETDPTKGTSGWFVTPRGRWCSKEEAIQGFNRSRDHTIDFVGNTDIDLRLHFTFRDIPDENDFRRVRDLHQILLTTITHTKRHIHQIERIKNHPDFPNP